MPLLLVALTADSGGAPQVRTAGTSVGAELTPHASLTVSTISSNYTGFDVEHFAASLTREPLMTYAAVSLEALERYMQLKRASLQDYCVSCNSS